MAPFTKQTLLRITALVLTTQQIPSSPFCWTESASYSGHASQKCFNCDWSVDATGVLSCLSLAHISAVDQMTAQTGSTEVGPIQFSNRSNNCRVGKINERWLSVARSHCAILRLSLSPRPTKDKNHIVWAGHKPRWVPEGVYNLQDSTT